MNGVSVKAYLDGLPSDVVQLASSTLELLREARGNSYEALSDRQQRPYDELADRCLLHLAQNPQSAQLFGKLGPNEEAYGINLLEIDDAVLRVHFYSAEGASAVQPSEFQRGPIDVERFGTPHNHVGNIAAVVPRGELIHHAFQITDGREYTAGRIDYVENPDPTTGYKFRKSVFVPQGDAGLECVSTDAFSASTGYRMGRENVHVVSWPKPTVTVFFNDFRNRHKSTIFQQAGVKEEMERPRALSNDERTRVWDAFTGLIAA